MDIRKNVLTDLDHCYSVAVMNINKEPYVFYATEARGQCLAFDCKTLSDCVEVWKEPGGTMSMVSIPNSGDFLAIQKFFRLYDWEEAELVWAKACGNNKFEIKPIVQLAYLHRFDVLETQHGRYLICCTLAEHKTALEDWSCPGKVYVAELPESLEEPVRLSVLMDNMTQNHGYSHIEWNGKPAAMAASAAGVFILMPPETAEDKWKIEKIMAQPVSDADMIDIDQDGEMEIATIEPFHGRFYRIYKKVGGQYQMIFEHEEKTDFYHVVKGAVICGRPVFIGGCRRGKQQLFMVRQKENSGNDLEVINIDEGVGPSNVTVLNLPDRDLIFSANREIGQATVYIITD